MAAVLRPGASVLATRRVEIAGITPNPGEAWMMQIGRNLTDQVDGSLADKQLFILDRDTMFSLAFRNLLKEAGVEAYAERFVRSIKSECLSRMIFFGERSLGEQLASTPLTTTGSGITRASTTG